MNECLNFLFHTEFLLTLAKVKPVSIIRAFENPAHDKAWREAWNTGVLNNPDILWMLKEHSSGPTLWVASKQALQSVLVNDGFHYTNSVFDEIEKHIEQLPSAEEKHRFYGKILGYPNSQVEKFASSTQQERGEAKRTAIFPDWFAPPIAGAFVVFDPEYFEMIEWRSRVNRAVDDFLKVTKDGTSLVDFFNLGTY